MFRPLPAYLFWLVIGIVALPFILLFTSREATRLPVLDRYLGNSKSLNYARAGIMRKNGDSWWWRYIWLGWRNPASNYGEQVVGYRTADIAEVTESGPFTDKGTYWCKVILKDGSVREQCYSWTPLFGKWGWYMKRGWKNHRRFVDERVRWVPPYGQVKVKEEQNNE